jgi:hypothetical protein
MGLRSKIRQVWKEKKTSGLKGSNGLSPPTTGPPGCGPAKTSSIPTTTVQPPGQVGLSASLPPNAATASPEPSTQPSASDVTPLPPSDFEPWTRAYEILQAREPELIEDYKKHLGSLQCDAATDADLLTPRSVESIVKQLLDDREKKQWRVSLLGKEVKIREQAERLAKFLLWSDPVVKNALSAQPYAALAWSGVSLVLPVGQCLSDYQANTDFTSYSRAALQKMRLC